MQSGEIKQLTGIRGVAAAIVMVAHINGDRLPVLKAFAYHNQAVDLFFCLSSFVLCLTYAAGTGAAFPVRKFYVARFARIYPLYAATLLATAVISAIVFGGFATYPQIGQDFVGQLLMINAWPLIGRGVHWDAAAWSVSVEAFCYLAIFPVVFVLSARTAAFSPAVRHALMLAVGAAGAVVGYWWFTAAVSSWALPHDALPATAFWSPVARGATMFAAGWLAYIAYANRDHLAAALQRHADAFVLLVLSLIGLTLAGVLPPWAALPLFAPMLIALMNGDSFAARALSAKPVYRLGVLSYSLYLVHFPVIYALRPIEAKLTPWLYVPTAVGITFAVAVLSYSRLEDPARVMLRDWLNRRPQAV
ncbi:exopolysaccharide production protein ExoZ [Hyphomicrobium sp. 1Nfss2.1]|uniref:acyltransferase family protein n=1 Tax=Hyphomicrobium sp. 1Nfss2.1 TaxID=3413936 RepID=UPI003C7CD53E